MNFTKTNDSILNSTAQMILNPVDLKGNPLLSIGRELFQKYHNLEEKMNDFITSSKNTTVNNFSIQIVHIGKNQAVVNLFISNKQTDLVGTLLHFAEVVQLNKYTVAVPYSLLDVVDESVRPFFLDSFKGFFTHTNLDIYLHTND